MQTPTTLMLAAAAAFALPLATQAAAPKPKVSPQQAEAVAVRKVPGKALSTKYEFEDGRWQYAVLVKSKQGLLYEVEVSSTVPKVTDMERTTPGEESREAAADKRAAMKSKH